MSREFYPDKHDPVTTLSGVRKKPMSFTISPETKATFQLGLLFAGASAIVTGTIFVWTIKLNVEVACDEIKAIRAEMVPAIKKVDRLWWDYEQRTGKVTNER